MPQCRECGFNVAENEEICSSCGYPQFESAHDDIQENIITAEEPATQDALPAPVLPDEISGSETSSADLVTAVPTEEKIDFDAPTDPAPEVELPPVSNSPIGETASPMGGETDGKRPTLRPLGEGTTLNNRYKIVRKIGGGGMGAVYLACDQNLGGVERAVKEMVQSSIEEAQQSKAIDDFKRESTILSTLDHPSIPTIYDYFYDNFEGRFYLVMKYISGGDLASRLRAAPGGRIDEKTVCEWALQVADVLAYLHGLPTTIVYRDLKPSNLMLDGK